MIKGYSGDCGRLASLRVFWTGIQANRDFAV